jgi:hydrogenase maturation protease
MRTLLLGMGNPIATDDAVGLRLARFLGERLAGPGLDVVDDCSVGGLELLPLLEGYQRVVVTDAIRTRGGIPASWYRFTAARLTETCHLSNVHDANFATALALGRRLGMALPPDDEIHVFAVEIKEDRVISDQMTPELEGAWTCYSAEILAEVEALLRA